MSTIKNQFCTNDVLNIFNSILRDNGLYSLEQFCLAFLSLSQEDKQIVYSDKDFLGNNLLMEAIEYMNSNIALTLIDLGFNTNIQNINGINPLINAIKYDQEELALHLIDYTEDLDFARSSNGIKNGDTALIYATDHHMFKVVKKLIESGADPFYKNEFKQNALFYCLKSNHEQYLDIFDYLLGIYQEKSFFDSMSGNIPEILFRHGTIEHFNIIASHGLEFPNLSQSRIDSLKNTSINTYAARDANPYNQYIELIHYWDKLKDMIKLNNKLSNKSSKKIKTSKI